MSQNDLSLANQSGASFRADLNAALQALASISSGSSAPSTTYAHQLWLDTTTATAPVLKQRNSANDAWITVLSRDANGNIGLSTTGAIDIPVGTTAQRPTPSEGMIRRNTTTSSFEGYNGEVWTSLGGGATGGGADECFVENSTTVTTTYTLSTGKSASAVGPLTINNGVIVTIPSGANLVIL